MNDIFLKSQTLVASGACTLSYNNEVNLNSCQIASGILQQQNRDIPLQRAGFQNARGLTPQNAEKASLMGSLAEVSVAIAFNQPFRTDFDPKMPDDFYINGHAVDVKCSTHPNLLIAARHLDRNKTYFSVRQLSEPKYRLVGYIHGKDVTEKYKRDPDGRGLAYLIPWKDLKPFRILCGPILD